MPSRLARQTQAVDRMTTNTIQVDAWRVPGQARGSKPVDKTLWPCARWSM